MNGYEFLVSKYNFRIKRFGLKNKTEMIFTWYYNVYITIIFYRIHIIIGVFILKWEKKDLMKSSIEK